MINYQQPLVQDSVPRLDLTLAMATELVTCLPTIGKRYNVLMDMAVQYHAMEFLDVMMSRTRGIQMFVPVSNFEFQFASRTVHSALKI